MTWIFAVFTAYEHSFRPLKFLFFKTGSATLANYKKVLVVMLMFKNPLVCESTPARHPLH
jgi:hypothetical protein